MTSLERVRAAIDFTKPDRPPVWFFNKDHYRGDILLTGLALPRDGVHEWGYSFHHLDDGTMGQPDKPVLPTWADVETFDFPTLRPEERAAGPAAVLNDAGGRYVLGGLGLSGFTLYTFLRGFENAMLDFAAERPRAEALLDRIFDFETEVCRFAADQGHHGVHFSDDWGTQGGLIIDPELWRDLFKERYRKQFAAIHDAGADVWFHSCGNITDIAEDLHEAGVDVLNISQPNAADTARIGQRLRGVQCFLIPISYQTVSISGTPQEIHAEARRLFHELGTPQGGFIGYVEEYGCMGMSEENYEACAEAFESLEPDMAGASAS